MKKSSLLSFVILVVFSTMASAQDIAEIYTKAINQFVTTNVALSLDVRETNKSGKVKTRSLDVLLGEFGIAEKTRIEIKEPVRAKGIVILITKLPEATGLIEIFTPANGKTRKLKATPKNIALVGSGLFLANFSTTNEKELTFTARKKEKLKEHGICHVIDVIERKKGGKPEKTTLFIKENSFHLVQVVSYTANDTPKNITKFSNFQALDGFKEKVQPMHIITKDIKSNALTEITVNAVTPQSTLTEDDFKIPSLSN